MASLRIGSARAAVTTASGVALRVAQVRVSTTVATGGSLRVGSVRAAVTISTIANAGPDVTGIEPGSVVTLTGNGTGTWDQVSGPAVIFSPDPNSSVRQYLGPMTLAGTTLVFRYTASGGSTDTTTHTVLPVTERAAIGGVEVPMIIRVGESPFLTPAVLSDVYTATYPAVYGGSS